MQASLLIIFGVIVANSLFNPENSNRCVFEVCADVCGERKLGGRELPIRLAAVVKKLSEGVAKQLSDNKIL